MALPTLILAPVGQSASPPLNAAVLNAVVGIYASSQYWTYAVLSGLPATGATVIFEGTTDNGATWLPVTAANVASAVTGTTTTVDGLYKWQTGTRSVFQVRVSSIGTGPINVGAPPGTTPLDVAPVSNAGGTQTVAGTYNATPPTRTDGQSGALQTDSNGRLLVGGIVGQRPFEAILTITRPANATAYAAGQVLSTAASGLTAFPTFALGIGNSQRFVIQSVVLLSSNGAAATKAQLSLFLFNAASPSGGGFNDAAAFAPTAAALAANGNALVGLVPSSLAQAGTAAYGLATYNVGLQGVTDSSGNIYPAIVLNNAYTPASSETISVKIVGYY